MDRWMTMVIFRSKLAASLCLLSFLVSNSTSAQSIVKTEIYRDGSYALIETRDGVATGTAKEFDKDDNLLAEYELTDGELNGTFLTYNPDGTLKSSEEYAEGQRHGLAKIYDERGYLQQVQRYEDGQFKELVPIHEAFEVLDDLSGSEVKHCLIADKNSKSLLREYWLFKLNGERVTGWYAVNADFDYLSKAATPSDIKNYAFTDSTVLIGTVHNATFMAHSILTDGNLSKLNTNEFHGYVCIMGSSQVGCALRSGLQSYAKDAQDIIDQEGDVSILPWIEKAYERPFRQYLFNPERTSLTVLQTVYVLTAAITFNSGGRRKTFLEYQYKSDPKHVSQDGVLECAPSTLEEMKVALQSDSNEG